MKYFLVFALALAGCAVGPLVSQESARTVGQSQDEIVAGYGTASYTFKWNHGFSDNLDFGIQLEALSVGVRAKYAFVNAREKGWSFAGAGGTGKSIGGSHYYVDGIASYLNGQWEPYSTLRIVHVKTDPLEFKDKDTGQVDFTVDRSTYEYGQFFLGSRFWFDKHWVGTFEVSSLFALSSGFSIGNNFLFNGGFGYHF